MKYKFKKKRSKIYEGTGKTDQLCDSADTEHGLKHNALARAQYKHWRSIQTGVPELLSVEDKRLLGLL